MPTRNVKELRLQGRLDEALAMAEDDLRQWPDDQWVHQSYGWVIDAYCKKYAQEGDVDKFIEYLNRLPDVIDVSQNEMLSGSLCWRVLALLKTYSQNHGEECFPAILDRLFESVKQFRQVPSKEYTVLFSAFHKHRQFWSHYKEFCDWWDFSNFTQDDYKEIAYSNGRTGMSLVEQAYMAYAKCILNMRNMESIRTFQPKMEVLADQHPEMPFIGYFNGKLLMEMDRDSAETLQAVIPFVKKKSTEFWVWQLVSEILKENEMKELACILRAVNCRTQEKFLGKLRLRLASFYVSQGLYAHAKEQIKKISTEKLKNGNKVPYEITAWSHESWFDNPVDGPDPNGYLSIDYMDITDTIIFGHSCTIMAYVTNLNEEKHVANVIYGMKKKGFFKYDRVCRNLKPNSLLKIRYTELDESKGFIKASKVEFLRQKPAEIEFMKSVQGTIASNKSGTVHFMRYEQESAFIPESILKSAELSTGDNAKGLLIYDFNKKRNEWNWKCIKIKTV